MKVLVVCHYFWPEIGAPQARLSEMAATWADDGCEVEVLTGFPNHPTGVIPPDYRGVRTMSQTRHGYRIIRTWLYATPNEGIVRKTLGHLSFMVSALVQGWRRVQRPDVVVVSSPTFFAILPAWLLARRFRVPFVVEVRDLWPAVFVDLGVLRNRSVIGLLEWLELAAYRAADLVVVVTDGFRADLERRHVPAAKIAVITNGVDLERFSPQPADPQVRARLGCPDDGDVLVAYVGAHGISHGLTSVVEASRSFGPGVHLALVGEGAAKKELAALVGADPRVTMLDGVARDDVPALLHAADILLVPLRDVPLFTTFIPSKMFEYLAAGTAVVGSVAGEAARILTDAGAVVVPPEQPDELAAAVADLAANPERRRSMGESGRRFVEAHYSRTTLARRYLALLDGLVGGGAGDAREGDRS